CLYSSFLLFTLVPRDLHSFPTRRSSDLKTLPSELCTDAEFIRRVSLDLVGLPPTPEEVRSFLADERDTNVKRAELVDRLVGSGRSEEHTSELQSRENLVCRLLLEKKNKN